MEIEKKVYSQNGEDGVIEFLLNNIDCNKEFFVEIGCEDGKECNSRYIKEKYNMDGIMFDMCNEIPEINLFKQKITKKMC